MTGEVPSQRAGCRASAMVVAVASAASLVLVACTAPGAGPDETERRAQESAAAASSSAELTTVLPAQTINAVGHRSARLASADPRVLIEHPQIDPGVNHKRIIALDRAGALSRMVWAMGLGDRLIGRDTSSDFPAIADRPLITPTGHSINAESLMALEPDLVITDGTIGPSRAIKQLENSGVTVVEVSADRTPETVSPLIDGVARAVGLADHQAQEIKDQFSQELADATAYAQAKADGRKMMVLYLRGTGVAMIAGPESGGRSLITRLGGIDAGEKLGITGSFTPLTPEALIAAQPDTLIVMSKGLESVGGIEGLNEVPGIAQTPAGKNHSVIDVPDSELLSFGADTAQEIRVMADALYGPQPVEPHNYQPETEEEGR